VIYKILEITDPVLMIVGKLCFVDPKVFVRRIKPSAEFLETRR